MSDDVLWVAGTLVDVVDVEVVDVGAVVVEGAVVGGVVVGVVVTGTVVGVVGGLAVAGTAVDGAGPVVVVVWAPAGAAAESTERPSRAVTMTAPPALRVMGAPIWRTRALRINLTGTPGSATWKRNDRDLRRGPLQLAEPLHITLDQRDGQPAALADFDPLPAGPSPHRRRPGQILVHQLGWQTAPLTHGNAVFGRPFADGGRLGQVQLN